MDPGDIILITTRDPPACFSVNSCCLSVLYTHILEKNQHRKEDTITTQDNATLARRAYDLYNDHQSDHAWLDKSLASIAEDCEIFLVPLGMTLRGHDGYKQFLLGWAEAFPDSRTEMTNLLTGEDHAIIEFIGRGTHTGTLHGPAGDIPPTGRKVEFRLCDVRGIKNGKFVSLHQYYDALGFMQQLGLIPSQG